MFVNMRSQNANALLIKELTRGERNKTKEQHA